jgi:hypothetical protein
MTKQDKTPDNEERERQRQIAESIARANGTYPSTKMRGSFLVNFPEEVAAPNESTLLTPSDSTDK